MNFAYGFEEVVDYGLVPALLTSLPSMFWKIAAYVLTSLALYAIAERRGLKNAWMAWLPVLNLWILGSISDQYRYVVKGENRSKRKILLILKIVSVICGIVLFCLGVAAVVNVIPSLMRYNSMEKIIGQVMGPVTAMMGVSVPMVGVGIALVVIQFMALHDVYVSMDPKNGVMFLVLSILFPVTKPFFLLLNRHKDLGMPPRKRAPVYEEPCVSQAEPWNRAEPDQM